MRAFCLVLPLLVAVAGGTAYAAPLVIQLAPVAARLMPRCVDCGVHTTTALVDTLPAHDPKVLGDLRRAANSGKPEDQFNFGHEQYLVATDGRNDPAGRRRGLKWLKRAAEQGFQPAEDELIGIYQKDDGPDYSPLLARQWRIKMAETGDIWAETLLANDYEVGYPGIEPDTDKMLYWYGKAANGGSIGAMITLAGFYEQRENQVDAPFADMDKAIYWYERGAALGDAYSQTRLAHIYEADGPHRDIAKAVKWHEARANDTTSFPNGYNMRRLAEIYAAAPEVRDAGKSFDWYERAVKAHDRPSQTVMCGHPDDAVPDHFVRARQACWRIDAAAIAADEAAALALLDSATPDVGAALDHLTGDLWQGGARAAEAIGRFATGERGTPEQQLSAGRQLWLAAGQGWPTAGAWMAAHPEVAARVTADEFDIAAAPAGYTALAEGPGGTRIQLPAAVAFSAAAVGSGAFDDNDVQELYPSGQFILICAWGEEGRVSACTVAQESPRFARVAVYAAKSLQRGAPVIQPAGAWAALSRGKWSAIVVNWTINE